MLAAVQALVSAGNDLFGPQDVIREMRRRGSRYKEATIRTHVVSSMCVNSPKNHDLTYDDLVRVNYGLYKLNDR